MDVESAGRVPAEQPRWRRRAGAVDSETCDARGACPSNGLVGAAAATARPTAPPNSSRPPYGIPVRIYGVPPHPYDTPLR